MKKYIKLLSLILVVTMICVSFTGCSFDMFSRNDTSDEENEGEVLSYSEIIDSSELLYPSKTDELRYNVYTNYVSISECISDGPFVSIPSEIEDKPVLRIEGGAFEKKNNIVSVIMADSIIDIGEYAFSECKDLQSIKLSNNLETIGRFAFNNCDNLRELNIPAKVSVIQEALCENCEKLASVSIEEGESKDGEEIVFPDVEIKNYAFSNCENLRSIFMSSHVSLIDEYAFEGSYENLTVYGYIASVSAHLAADNLTDFVIIDKGDYTDIAKESIENMENDIANEDEENTDENTDENQTDNDEID